MKRNITLALVAGLLFAGSSTDAQTFSIGGDFAWDGHQYALGKFGLGDDRTFSFGEGRRKFTGAFNFGPEAGRDLTLNVDAAGFGGWGYLNVDRKTGLVAGLNLAAIARQGEKSTFAGSWWLGVSRRF